MPSVRRFDRGELSKPKRLTNGWLKVDGYIGRTGLLEYKHADGTTWVEYRPAAEAFSDALFDSFEGVPLTNDHPERGTVLLDASNTKQFQVGTVGRPTQDGNKIRASIMVTDADAIADIEGGKVELSQGYSCDLDCTPGTHEGRHYDAIQRNVTGNHVALVDRARAGAEIRLRVDGHDSLPVESVGKQLPGQPAGNKTQMIKIKIDGVEVEVSETAAQLIAKSNASTSAVVSALTGERDAAKARADGFEADAKKLKIELEAAPAKARAAIESRIKLEASATKILGAEAKLDGLSDLDVKRLVAVKGGYKVEGKADAYTEAAFDFVIDKADAAPGALAPATAPATAPVKTDAGEDSLEAAQAKFRAEMREMHKNKPQAKQ